MSGTFASYVAPTASYPATCSIRRRLLRRDPDRYGLWWVYGTEMVTPDGGMTIITYARKDWIPAWQIGWEVGSGDA